MSRVDVGKERKHLGKVSDGGLGRGGGRRSDHLDRFVEREAMNK
jgi:hypothetical protein